MIVVMAGALIVCVAHAGTVGVSQVSGDLATPLPADGACQSSACTDRAAQVVVDMPATPTPPNHVLLLAAVGAVAFVASRRHFGG
jgi:hypothetical protein